MTPEAARAVVAVVGLELLKFCGQQRRRRGEQWLLRRGARRRREERAEEGARGKVARQGQLQHDACGRQERMQNLMSKQEGAPGVSE